MTLHDRAIEYVAKKVQGKSNHILPMSKAFKYGQHSYPDVIVGIGHPPTEMHEVQQLIMNEAKLDDYAAATPKTVLWLFNPRSIINSFREIRIMYLEDDYFYDEPIWRREHHIGRVIR